MPVTGKGHSQQIRPWEFQNEVTLPPCDLYERWEGNKHVLYSFYYYLMQGKCEGGVEQCLTGEGTVKVHFESTKWWSGDVWWIESVDKMGPTSCTCTLSHTICSNKTKKAAILQCFKCSFRQASTKWEAKLPKLIMILPNINSQMLPGTRDAWATIITSLQHYKRNCSSQQVSTKIISQSAKANYDPYMLTTKCSQTKDMLKLLEKSAALHLLSPQHFDLWNSFKEGTLNPHHNFLRMMNEWRLPYSKI